MMNTSIYRDIAERTGGNIYIGVVGPVRTGKSTFIKKFMETLVLPNITDPYDRERAKDEMPQSAAGKTVMTAEPKFIPDEAVEISLADNAKLRVRMIDCVGYIVPEALGHIENGGPRMVHTPWQKEAYALYGGCRNRNKKSNKRSFHNRHCRYNRRNCRRDTARKLCRRRNKGNK